MAQLQPAGLAEAQQALHTAVTKGDVPDRLVAGSGQQGQQLGQHLQWWGCWQAGTGGSCSVRRQMERMAQACGCWQVSGSKCNTSISTHFPLSPLTPITSTHLAAQLPAVAVSIGSSGLQQAVGDQAAARLSNDT